MTSGVASSPWHVDYKKGIKLLTDPELWAPVNKMPVNDAKKLVQYYKDQYKKAKQNGYTKSYNTFIKEMNWGRGLDLQKHLSKLGELHMRTPTMKKYNYCGPGTKLEERLASNDPKVRDPINNLDSICQRHDIAYSKAKNLKDKHKADDVMLDEISKIPYKKRPWGTTTVQAMITYRKKKIRFGSLKAKKRKTPSSEESWQERLADELHKPIKRDFTRRRVIVNHIDQIWCSDLVEMQQFSKWNKGYRYLLMVLDVFSKYGWIVPLKDKKRRNCG